ncbi:hypothetical protein GCM10027055_00030 [Janibacter alkaliphilus]|uniref:Uncharacterized protein n=1 Tax=Janibacter alkaliphilus TaxID=1069963 RepID=A0A852X775_9MICO|nr:DUF6301 family protein [Janibacter alkaliphilus]NYG36623.1 hypothetical protein [Janibacter alkaliphilus]
MGEPMGSELVVGEWSWAPVEEVVAWARFWASASWPMTEDVAIDLGVAHLGWSVDEKGAAVGPWPLNRPGVTLSRDYGDKDCHGFSFKVTDVVGRPEELLDADGQRLWEAFLRDRFTLLVRALTPELRESKRLREKLEDSSLVTARWDLPDGGIRWDVTQSAGSVTCWVSSPESAQVERNLGN